MLLNKSIPKSRQKQQKEVRVTLEKRQFVKYQLVATLNCNTTNNNYSEYRLYICSEYEKYPRNECGRKCI